MKFLVDNQLPTALARWLVSEGYDAVHVLDVQLAQSKDKDVWDYAQKESRISISKDEDFFQLATHSSETGRLLWIRIPNCRKAPLLERIGKEWPRITKAFENGESIIELR